MSKVLRHGRERVTIDEEAAEAAMPELCPNCGKTMTHHADKATAAAAASESDAVIAATLACSGCGEQQTTLTTAPASDLP